MKFLFLFFLPFKVNGFKRYRSYGECYTIIRKLKVLALSQHNRHKRLLLLLRSFVKQEPRLCAGHLLSSLIIQTGLSCVSEFRKTQYCHGSKRLSAGSHTLNLTGRICHQSLDLRKGGQLENYASLPMEINLIDL